MSPSHRVSTTARAAMAAVLAFPVAMTPLSASAIIDRGMGEPNPVLPGLSEPDPQVVTAGGWYNATDLTDESAPITLANADSEESFDLPEGSELMGFTDDWALWATDTGAVGFRSMDSATVRTLGTVDAFDLQDQVVDGDRLVAAEPFFSEDSGAIVAYTLPGGAAVSTPYAPSELAGTGLVASGDWAVWAEATGDGDVPDSWDVRAWNMSTGESFAIAEGVQAAGDGYLDETLQVAEGRALWIDAEGAHVFDLASRAERVVAVDPDGIALTGDWVAWATTPPGGTAGIDDVFALDLSQPVESAAVVPVTSSPVGEWGVMGADGWVVFQVPDPAGKPGVVTAVDLDSLVTVQVSDPSNPNSTVNGIDGQRVTWVNEGTDEDDIESYDLVSRVLGLPGPTLKERYTSTTPSCDVTWTPVAAADYYEYQVGESGSVQTTTATSVTVDGLEAGVAVPVTVWAVRGEVKSEPQETFAVQIGALSKLTISPKATTVSLNSNASFTCKLTAGSKVITAAPVYLEYSVDGQTGWSEVLDSERETGSGGTVALTAQAARTLYYRAVYSGDEGHSEAYSPAVKIAAKAAVGTPVFPSSVKKGRKTTVTGVLRPDGFVHPSKSVTVYAYHLEGSKWVVRAKATATVTYSEETFASSYKTSLTLTRTGKWRLQAVYAGSSIAAKNSSSYRNCTVK